MPFPDFLVIGAQKGGTSWLYKNLSRHPDIWTPPLKELHYFDERIKEPSFGALVARLIGKEYTNEYWYPWYWRYQLKERFQQHRKNFDLETAIWDFKFFVRSPSDRWYASLFEQGRGKITGEVTPEYSNLEAGIIAHMHKLMPNAKIIYFMRNPIERIYSTMVKRFEDLKLMGQGVEVTGQGVEATTDEQLFKIFCNPETINPGLVAETKYLESLEKWRRCYPDEQIFIGFLEDIHFYPGQLLFRLYKFLGVDPLGVDLSRAWRTITRKVNAGPQEKIPTRLAVHLAHTFYEDLRHLSARFGGYTSFWLYCAERLTKNTLAGETIGYPLWGSWLWEEWARESHLSTQAEAQDSRVQSRALA